LIINASLNGIVYNEVFNINTGANAAAYFGIVTQNLANSGTIRSGMFFDSSNHLNLINGEAGGAGIVLDDNNVVTMSGDVTVDGALAIGSGSELTISTGAITPTTSYHIVDTEGDAASDNLDTIAAGTTRTILILSPANAARTVVLKDGTGNLQLAGDFSMDSNLDFIVLFGIGSSYFELTRSNNG
jgi:hypothetical protein